MSRRTFGSARRLPSGRWQASYWHEGKRFVGSVTFGSRSAANGWLSSVEASVRSGTWIDPRGGEVTFAQWSEWYFEGATHKRATTMARDKTVTRTHLIPTLGQKHLAEITPIDVRKLVRTMSASLAPTTVRTNYGVLRAILAAAVEADLLVRSPCRGVKMPPHRRKEVRFLSPEELERLAEALPLEYRAMAYVAGVVGLRWSEVAGLRVGSVDLPNRTITVRETLAEVEGRVAFADVKSPASRRTVSMPGFVASTLAKHLLRCGRPGPEALVFVGPDGGPLHGGNFRNRVWAPAVKRAGLEGLTFHGLRHSAAGFLIAVGAPDHVLQERMGHSSSRVTRDVYGHVLPAVHEAVTADLERLFADPASVNKAARAKPGA